MSDYAGNWQLQAIPVGPLQMNAVLLTAETPGGGETILIDPGEEAPKLLALIAETGHKLSYLLATHGHFDHVGAAAAVQEVHDVPLTCHPESLPLIDQMPEIQAAYGFPCSPVPRCAGVLADGDQIGFAGDQITVRHIPGHSPGQVMFLLPGFSPQIAVVGDCLFCGSVGRTDLPGGDFPTLEASIRDKIYALADDTIVVSGHGPDTTVGREKATNPWVPMAR